MTCGGKAESKMPRTRAQKNKQESQVSTNKANELTETKPKEAIRIIHQDLEDQVPRIIDTARRKFEREALKCVRQLPDKSCFPPEIYHMPLSTYIMYGGTVESVMETLREKKKKEFKDAEVVFSDQERLANEIQITENETDDFVTPAVQNRLRPTIPPSTKKRPARQLEEVELMIKSKATGSPLNEKATMEHILQGMVDQVMGGVVSKLPKKTQSMVTKAVEQHMLEMNKHFRQDGETCFLVTPSTQQSTKPRTRKN